MYAELFNKNETYSVELTSAAEDAGQLATNQLSRIAFLFASNWRHCALQGRPHMASNQHMLNISKVVP
jgi:hypothetical protein